MKRCVVASMTSAGGANRTGKPYGLKRWHLAACVSRASTTLVRRSPLPRRKLRSPAHLQFETLLIVGEHSVELTARIRLPAPAFRASSSSTRTAADRACGSGNPAKERLGRSTARAARSERAFPSAGAYRGGVRLRNEPISKAPRAFETASPAVMLVL
jgi:hypothetical protein